jgi:hypothetical protein
VRRTPLSPELKLFKTMRSNVVCPLCGESDPLAMTKHGLCYECCQHRHGRPTTEYHHVFGHNDEKTIIAIPGNLHRSIDQRRSARLPVLKELHGGDPIIRAAQTLVTAAELNDAICRRARHAIDRAVATTIDPKVRVDGAPRIEEGTGRGARCRGAVRWLLVLHHWVFRNSDRRTAKFPQKPGTGLDDAARQSPLIEIARLCSAVAGLQPSSLFGNADPWKAPTTKLENAIARQCRIDAASLLEINSELLRRFGSDWHYDEALLTWQI